MNPEFKLIPLSRGMFAKVSPEDYEQLSKFKWHAVKSSPNGPWYAQRTWRVGDKTLASLMHRDILRLSPGDRRQADHRTPSETLDNRRTNLRIATPSQNRMNETPRKNKSGFRGVVFRADCNKWQARIKRDHVEHYLGLFKTAEEAHGAYCEAAKKLHGEFARVK